MDVPSPALSFSLQAVSYAAVAFHLYEWLDNLPFEKQYFWRKRRLGTLARYMASRYGAIMCQVAYAIMMNTLFSRRTDYAARACRCWYAMQAVTSQLLLLLLELTCVQRLEAFYERKSLIWALKGLVVCEAIIVVTCGFISLVRVEFGGMCLVKSLGHSLYFIPFLQVCVHLTILTFTVMKGGNREVPVFVLVVRDGSWTFLAVMVLVTGCYVQMLLSTFKRINPFTYQICYPLYVAGITTWNCRTIRNMELFLDGDPRQDEELSSSVILSTVFHSIISDSEGGQPVS